MGYYGYGTNYTRALAQYSGTNTIFKAIQRGYSAVIYGTSPYEAIFNGRSNPWRGLPTYGIQNNVFPMYQVGPVFVQNNYWGQGLGNVFQRLPYLLGLMEGYRNLERVIDALLRGRSPDSRDAGPDIDTRESSRRRPRARRRSIEKGVKDAVESPETRAVIKDAVIDVLKGKDVKEAVDGAVKKAIKDAVESPETKELINKAVKDAVDTAVKKALKGEELPKAIDKAVKKAVKKVIEETPETRDSPKLEEIGPPKEELSPSDLNKKYNELQEEQRILRKRLKWKIFRLEQAAKTDPSLKPELERLKKQQEVLEDLRPNTIADANALNRQVTRIKTLEDDIKKAKEQKQEYADWQKVDDMEHHPELKKHYKSLKDSGSTDPKADLIKVLKGLEEKKAAELKELKGELAKEQKELEKKTDELNTQYRQNREATDEVYKATGLKKEITPAERDNEYARYRKALVPTIDRLFKKEYKSLTDTWIDLGDKDFKAQSGVTRRLVKIMTQALQDVGLSSEVDDKILVSYKDVEKQKKKADQAMFDAERIILELKETEDSDLIEAADKAVLKARIEFIKYYLAIEARTNSHGLPKWFYKLSDEIIADSKAGIPVKILEAFMKIKKALRKD